MDTATCTLLTTCIYKRIGIEQRNQSENSVCNRRIVPGRFVLKINRPTCTGCIKKFVQFLTRNKCKQDVVQVCVQMTLYSKKLQSCLLSLYISLFLCNYQSWKCCQRPELVWLILRAKRPRGRPERNNLKRPGEVNRAVHFGRVNITFTV